MGSNGSEKTDIYHGNAKKTLVLDMLKKSGKEGVENTELIKIALRFSSILHSLRKEGYLIEVIDKGKGRFNYVLVGFESPHNHVSAYERLFDLVAEYDKVSTSQLLSVLKQNNICFKRKAIR
ncbi:hypothetical protein BXO87_02340 [Bacillus sp. GZB]|uniref:hypothetical protein n=1 Tax=Bacillus sp. GZB TaxID=936599 RepID=UPI0009782C4F|nr:hypothetical protein [Bacillus sp. GZB]OMQ06865.1 hypothetical protein BXO87_02340 [Bacillus sp. GZB]